MPGAVRSTQFEQPTETLTRDKRIRAADGSPRVWKRHQPRVGTGSRLAGREGVKKKDRGKTTVQPGATSVPGPLCISELSCKPLDRCRLLGIGFVW